MRPIRFALGIACALALAGCASDQIHYHTLMAEPPAQVSAPAAPSAAYTLEVLPVGLPALVDREELVVRQGERLAIIDGERWAGTLGDEVHNTLAARLQADLGAQDVAGLVPSAQTPVLRVKLMVRDFQSAPGRYALLEADWSLTRSDKPQVDHPVCHSRFSVPPVDGGFGGLTAAHRQALGLLATQIAQTARAWMAGGAPACVAGR